MRNLTIASRQIGHAWQFNQKEWQELQQYWYANQLLLDCLNSAADVTPKVRESIENSLLLPSSKIRQKADISTSSLGVKV